MMKPLLILSTFVSISIVAFTQDAIGDVKYSALPPGTFTRLHPDWILMDGGASGTTDSLFKISKLHLQYKLATLPDARGVFIRGMNEKRSPDTGDPTGDRPVGVWQADVLKKHKHWVAYKTSMKGDFNGYEFTQNPDFEPRKQPMYTKEDGGDEFETRPRNIPFYVYIKIN